MRRTSDSGGWRSPGLVATEDPPRNDHLVDLVGAVDLQRLVDDAAEYARAEELDERDLLPRGVVAGGVDLPSRV